MKRIKIILNTFLSRMKYKKNNIKISLLAFFDQRCTFEDNVYLDRFCTFHKVNVGRFTYFGYGCNVSNCSIGRFCSVAGDVKIGLGKHPFDRVSTSPVFYSFNNRFRVKWNNDETVIESEPTIIGNDVWIGTNAIIVGGVTVGNGAVIAAGAIVTRDVEPFAIVGGVPAKTIKYRFDKDTVDKIEHIKWWEWNENRIRDNISKFNSVEDLLKL